MDAFSGYHPLINFTYFTIVIGLSMFYMHPVFLALSLAGSVSYSIYLKGRKTVKVFLIGMLPVCLLTMVMNPLFSHAGATMLFYMRNGNPVTLESIMYGLASGLMLAGVISWFSVFHEVILLHSGDDLGQIHVSFRKGGSGLFAAAVHDPAVCTAVYSPD